MVCNRVVAFLGCKISHDVIEIFLLLDTIVYVSQMTQKSFLLRLILAGPEEIHFTTLFELVLNLVSNPVQQGIFIIVLK